MYFSSPIFVEACIYILKSTKLFDMLIDSSLYWLSYLDHNIVEARICIVTPLGKSIYEEQM